MAPLLYLSIALLGVVVADDPCYQGWTFNSTSCYGFSDSQVSWSEAATLCRIYLGHLVEIESEEENEFVKEFVSDKDADNIWIGGTDIFSEGTWEWQSDGGHSFNFTDWYPGEPSDSHNGQDCANLVQHHNYQWGDESCSSNYNFICEIDIVDYI